MDKQRFEVTMSKFFEKVGVEVLKKGEGYPADTDNASYVLLDEKRNSYYFAESDLAEYDDSLAMQVGNYYVDAGIPKKSANAILALARAYKNTRTDFSIEGRDISSLTCQTSLIISEADGEKISDYLKSQGITFQAVPFKGAFVVMFFNPSMSEKIVSIYEEYADLEMPSSDFFGEDTPITPVFTPSEESDVNPTFTKEVDEGRDPLKPLVEPKEEGFNIPQKESDEEELSLNIPEVQDEVDLSIEKEETVKEDINDADTLSETEEEMLDNIDLSDILKPATEDEEPKDEAESDLLYGKLLKEQTDKIEVSNVAPAAKHLEDVPEGILDEADLKEAEEEAVKEDKEKSSKKDKKEKKAKAEKQAAREEKEENSNGRFRLLSLPGKAMANCIGFLFFPVVFMLNKLIGRFLPKFIIYWLSSIAAIFGLYQIALSKLLSFHYDNFNEYAVNAMNTMLSFTPPADRELSALEQIASSMVSQAAVMFSGELNIMVFLQSSWLLHFLMSGAAVLMIVPAFRKIGKTLTIFAILAYLALPEIVLLQSKLISYAVTLAELNNIASLVYFSIYFLPVLLLLFILYISAAIVPDESKHREVLP